MKLFQVTRARTKPSVPGTRVLLACLMLLSFLAQPVLALAEVNLGGADCPMEASGCCGPAEDLAPAPQELDTGCCAGSEDGPSLSEEPGAAGCACRLDSNPMPLTDPALPTGRSLGCASQATSKWLQDQHSLSESLPGWMPWNTSALLSPGDPGPLGDQGQAAEEEAGRACHWQRLTRGLVGYLAILSVARL